MIANFVSAMTSDSKAKDRPSRLSSSIFDNIYIVTILLYGAWGLLGVIFYYYVDDWTWATSFFFAMQAGLSVGFCEPVEHSDQSRLFTVFYILLGSSVVAGSIGKFAAELLYTRVCLHRHIAIAQIMFYSCSLTQVRISGKRKQRTIRDYLEADGDVPTFLNKMDFLWYQLKLSVGWYTYRQRVILTLSLLVWIGVGVIYGMCMEEWSFVMSLYFTVSCLSTAGLQTPTCNGSNPETCSLTNERAVYLGFFMLIGVPLYAVTVGQFAGLAVVRAAEAKRRERMQQPIEAHDFHYASTLLSDKDSTTLEMGEFIILELMRLDIVDRKQIKSITARFKELDIKRNNVLDFEELRLGGYIIEGKIHKRFHKPIVFQPRQDHDSAASANDIRLTTRHSESNLLSLISAAAVSSRQDAGFAVQRVLTDTVPDLDYGAKGRIHSFFGGFDRAAAKYGLIEEDVMVKSPNNIELQDFAVETGRAAVVLSPRHGATPVSAPLKPVFMSEGRQSSFVGSPSPTASRTRANSIVTSSGVIVPILPPNLLPKIPKAYDSNSDAESDEDISDHSSDDEPGNSGARNVPSRLRSKSIESATGIAKRRLSAWILPVGSLSPKASKPKKRRHSSLGSPSAVRGGRAVDFQQRDRSQTSIIPDVPHSISVQIKLSTVPPTDKRMRRSFSR